MSRGHSKRVTERQLKNVKQRNRRKRKSGDRLKSSSTTSVEDLEKLARCMREEHT
jgi:hypothetical protein